MKLFLDDERMPPSSEWIIARTAKAAIKLLKTGGVTFISLDHDLGDTVIGNGYTVARYLEREAFLGNLPPIGWKVHSQNPVGAEKIRMTMKAADRYWQV